jgi:hypothetical protein
MAKWHLWLGNAACFAVACGGGATTSPDSSSTDSAFATSTTPSNNNPSIVAPTTSATGAPPPTSPASTDAPTATSAPSFSTTDGESPTTDTASVPPQDDSSAGTGTETTGDGPATSDTPTDSYGEESETSADTFSNTSDDTSAPDSTDECPHHGTVTYRFNNPESWPADVVSRLTAAMDEATYYYNCYSDLSKSLTINYNPGVPTAEGNVDGVISFGSSLSYMVTATSMHEIAHTLGVGYAPWTELIQDGRWVGQAVNEMMTNLPTSERDPDMYSQRTYITCDNQHFWPYGLNQATEHQSEWSLINHVRVVAAMDEDKRAARGN